MLPSGTNKMKIARVGVKLSLTSADWSHHYCPRGSAEVAFSVGQGLPCARGIPWDQHNKQTGQCFAKFSLALKTKKRPLQCLGVCLQAAPRGNLTLKCHAAENTCLLCVRTSPVPTTSGIRTILVVPTSIQAIPKTHTLYLTLSASMKLILTCHLKCKHK